MRRREQGRRAGRGRRATDARWPDGGVAGCRRPEQRPQSRQVADVPRAQLVAQPLASGAAEHVAPHRGDHLVGRSRPARHRRHHRRARALTGATRQRTTGDVVQLGDQLDLGGRHQGRHRRSSKGRGPGRRSTSPGRDDAAAAAPIPRTPGPGPDHRPRQLVTHEALVWADRASASRTGSRWRCPRRCRPAIARSRPHAVRRCGPTPPAPRSAPATGSPGGPAAPASSASSWAPRGPPSRACRRGAVVAAACGAHPAGGCPRRCARDVARHGRAHAGRSGQRRARPRPYHGRGPMPSEVLLGVVVEALPDLRPR